MWLHVQAFLADGNVFDAPGPHSITGGANTKPCGIAYDRGVNDGSPLEPGPIVVLADVDDGPVEHAANATVASTQTKKEPCRANR